MNNPGANGPFAGTQPPPPNQYGNIQPTNPARNPTGYPPTQTPQGPPQAPPSAINSGMPPSYQQAPVNPNIRPANPAGFPQGGNVVTQNRPTNPSQVQINPPGTFPAKLPVIGNTTLQPRPQTNHIEQEKRSFSEYLNNIQPIATDPILKIDMPLNPLSDDLFRVCSKSILFCRLINCIRPGTIEEKRIRLKTELSIFEMNDNHALAIAGARTIGCKIINIGPEDLTRGQPNLILGMLWQLIRLSLLSQVNLQQHPEIIALKEASENVKDFVELPPELTLLRWINHHLRNAGYPRRVINFSDIDADCYAVLLHQLAPNICGLEALQEADPMKKAEMVLQNAAKINCRQFLQPRDIVEKNENLNLAFLANLFNTHPNLVQDHLPNPALEAQRAREIEDAVRQQVAAQEQQLRARMQQEEQLLRARLQQLEQNFQQRMEQEEAIYKQRWAQEEAKRQQAAQFAEEEHRKRLAQWEAEQARKTQEWRLAQEQQNVAMSHQLSELEQMKARILQEREQLEEERRKRDQRNAQTAAQYSQTQSNPSQTSTQYPQANPQTGSQYAQANPNSASSSLYGGGGSSLGVTNNAPHSISNPGNSGNSLYKGAVSSIPSGTNPGGLYGVSNQSNYSQDPYSGSNPNAGGYAQYSQASPSPQATQPVNSSLYGSNAQPASSAGQLANPNASSQMPNQFSSVQSQFSMSGLPGGAPVEYYKKTVTTTVHEYPPGHPLAPQAPAPSYLDGVPQLQSYGNQPGLGSVSVSQSFSTLSGGNSAILNSLGPMSAGQLAMQQASMNSQFGQMPLGGNQDSFASLGVGISQDHFGTNMGLAPQPPPPQDHFGTHMGLQQQYQPPSGPSPSFLDSIPNMQQYGNPPPQAGPSPSFLDSVPSAQQYGNPNMQQYGYPPSGYY